MNEFAKQVQNLPEGHPCKVYFMESDLVYQILNDLSQANPKDDILHFTNIFNQLLTIEKRFARKEHQLFPFLEKHGWNGPSQGMWAFHDSIRDQIRVMSSHLKDKNLDQLQEVSSAIVDSLSHLLQVEEVRLFPTAMSLLSEDDWKEMRKGEEEIGWMLKSPPESYPKDEYIHPSKDVQKRKLPFSIEDRHHYDEGYLTPEHVNLLLKFLPIDITYVDENDKVIFYNRGEKRVFPRSAGIIGREVRFCHPPKSVDMVLRIVDEFKNGTKDEAEFWIQFKGQMVHIRYFAIRDENKNYKGVIEMTQDITDIQKLKGEKRLLDWE